MKKKRSKGSKAPPIGTGYANDGAFIKWNVLQLVERTRQPVLTNEGRSARYMVKRRKLGAEQVGRARAHLCEEEKTCACVFIDLWKIGEKLVRVAASGAGTWSGQDDWVDKSLTFHGIAFHTF